MKEDKLPSKEQNSDGLHNKYIVSRVDGTPIDPENVYFLLKLQGKGDPVHMEACRKAVLTYADEIEPHLPKFAEDIRSRYAK